MFVAIEFSIVFWSTDFFETELGLSGSTAAAAGTFLLGMAVGRALGGRLAQRIAAEATARLCARLDDARLRGVLAGAGRRIAVPGLFLAGLGVSLLYPLTLTLGIAASGGRTDAASARAAFGAGIAIALAPFVLGALADQTSLARAYAIVPVLLAAGAATLFAARSRGA